MIDYYTYLQSPAWQEQRKAALRRAGNRCQICAGKNRLQAHHNTYENLGNERPEDLVVLCARCHALFSKVVQDPSPFYWLGLAARAVVEMAKNK